MLKKFRKLISSCLSLILFSACAWGIAGAGKQPPPATAAAPGQSVAMPPAVPKPNPYVAYLNEGNLWAMRADGTGLRRIGVAPRGESIQDFLWSPNGQRVYYAIGHRFYDVAIETGNLANGGELTAPAGVTIDRLELGRDGRTLLVHALEADSQARVYAVTVGEREARELAVDEYNALAPVAAPIVRQVGEMSVSPDTQFVLFKEVVGTGEELYVAELETGRKWQVSNLSVLYGFEPSAETMGGRNILEATWSPDGHYIIFNPSQSCSDIGLCYGRLFLVDRWGGPQLQLSIDMMISLPLEWNGPNTLLAYDDGSEIVLSDTSGQTKRLADGNHPKWQPLAE